MRSLIVINRKSLHNPKPMAVVAVAYIAGLTGMPAFSGNPNIQEVHRVPPSSEPLPLTSFEDPLSESIYPRWTPFRSLPCIADQ